MTSRSSMTVTSVLILLMKLFSASSLPCDRGQYQSGDDCCSMCPAGRQVEKHCTKVRNTSCLPCTAGTFMNQPTARTQCYTCLRCNAGLSLKTTCTTTSDAVCEPLEGFYCVFSKGDGCVRAHEHRSCQPGQSIRKKGTASSDTLCSRCPDGTFSDGTLTLCRPHTQCELKNLRLIKAGNAAADAECGEKSSNRTGIVIDVVAFAVVVLLLGAVLFFLYKTMWKRKRNTEEQSADSHSLEPVNVRNNIVDASEQQKDTTALIQTCDQ
ncbi:hypothetical protein Q5P01_007048 [Channa striata]|uniref:TNFR-Cys domain-containing protein n=1 Tax=Channa striata TaxID=64152 RepID=A0AA88N8J7_CHASR|nr:hypothetical protein Q5P01_007048 [Channa striata]